MTAVEGILIAALAFAVLVGLMAAVRADKREREYDMAGADLLGMLVLEHGAQALQIPPAAQTAYYEVGCETTVTLLADGAIRIAVTYPERSTTP